jgi:hypothetical protein
MKSITPLSAPRIEQPPFQPKRQANPQWPTPFSERFPAKIGEVSALESGSPLRFINESSKLERAQTLQ